MRQNGWRGQLTELQKIEKINFSNIILNKCLLLLIINSNVFNK